MSIILILTNKYLIQFKFKLAYTQPTTFYGHITCNIFNFLWLWSLHCKEISHGNTIIWCPQVVNYNFVGSEFWESVGTRISASAWLEDFSRHWLNMPLLINCQIYIIVIERQMDLYTWGKCSHKSSCLTKKKSVEREKNRNKEATRTWLLGIQHIGNIIYHLVRSKDAWNWQYSRTIHLPYLLDIKNLYFSKKKIIATLMKGLKWRINNQNCN